MTMTAQRCKGVQRGSPITFTVNGRRVSAYEGESIAAALMAAGHRVFRRTVPGDSPRGVFCGMGMCYDCLVTVDGVPNVRACMSEVREGCVVEVVDSMTT